MKKMLAVISLIAPILLAGCGDTHESLALEMNEELHELELILNDIDNASSFKTSKGDIETIGKKIEDIVVRVNSLDEPSLEDVKKIRKITGGPDSPMVRIHGQLRRLKRMPGGYAMVSEVNRLALSNLKGL